MPEEPVIYARTSASLHLTWRCPRSRGRRILQYEVQRKRLKGKYDRGVPSDDELELLQSAAAGDNLFPKVRRRVEGQMLDMYEHEWQNLGVFDEAGLLLPPPSEAVLPHAVAPTPAELARELRRAVPLVEATPAEQQEDLLQFEYVCKPEVAGRVEAVRAGEWVPEDARPQGMTSVKYRYLASDVLLPNSCHEFRVRARNSVGWSEWSKSSLAAKCLPSRPYRPGVPHIDSGMDDPVSFRWSHARNNGLPIKHYELTYCKITAEIARALVTRKLVDIPPPPNDTTDVCVWKTEALVPGRAAAFRSTLYQATFKERQSGVVVRRVYRLRAQNSQGWSGYTELSEVFIFTGDSCTS